MEKFFAMLPAASLTNTALAGTKGTTDDATWNQKVWATFRTFYGDASNGVVAALADDKDWAPPATKIPPLNADVAALLQSLLKAIPLPSAGANNPLATGAQAAATAAATVLKS
jgi:hypothetical protein